MMAMKTIAEIRLSNLKKLIEENISQERVASLCDTSPVYLSQLVNKAADKKTGKPRQIGDDMARKLETGCEKEIGWMDNIHSGAQEPVTTQPLIAAESIAVYAIQPQPDPRTQKLLNLWNELDSDGKNDLLGRVDFFVAGRRPHQDGQAHTVANQK